MADNKRMRAARVLAGLTELQLLGISDVGEKVSMRDFLRGVDHAATMNDHWLFLAAIGFLVLSGAVVIRWLAKQLESR